MSLLKRQVISCDKIFPESLLYFTQRPTIRHHPPPINKVYIIFHLEEEGGWVPRQAEVTQGVPIG